MRRFKVVVETPSAADDLYDFFEVEDDATDEDIEAEAQEMFYNMCSYGYHEVPVDEDGENHG